MRLCLTGPLFILVFFPLGFPRWWSHSRVGRKNRSLGGRGPRRELMGSIGLGLADRGSPWLLHSGKRTKPRIRSDVSSLCCQNRSFSKCDSHRPVLLLCLAHVVLTNPCPNVDRGFIWSSLPVGTWCSILLWFNKPKALTSRDGWSCCCRGMAAIIWNLGTAGVTLVS